MKKGKLKRPKQAKFISFSGKGRSEVGYLHN